MLNHPKFKEFQKSSAIIFFAMLVGLIIFALISLAIHNYGGGFANAELRTIGFIVVPFFVLVGIVFSRIFSNRLMGKAILEQDIEEKFNKYRSALIVRLAMLETPGIIAISMFLLTGERFFLGFLGILLFYFVTLFPSEPKIMSELYPDEEAFNGER